MKPEFIIVGAQKCGTTNLWDILEQHPDIYMAVDKEPHYFTRHTLYPEHPWYQKLFDKANGRMAGEATTSYCFWPGAIERIKHYNPDVKLIMIVRNPTERAISHYWHERAGNYEVRPLKEALVSVEDRMRTSNGTLQHILYHHSYLMRGLYANQLQRMYHFFKMESILVVTLQDLIDYNGGVITKILNFLGLKVGYIYEGDRKRRKGGYPPTPPEITTHLNDYYGLPNERLFQQYDIDVREPTRERIET